MPQNRLKNTVVEDAATAGARPRPYDAVDGDFGPTPGENHVAALQNLIYARFASDDEHDLISDAGDGEDSFALISRIGGVLALIAALAALAAIIF